MIQIPTVDEINTMTPSQRIRLRMKMRHLLREVEESTTALGYEIFNEATATPEEIRNYAAQCLWMLDPDPDAAHHRQQLAEAIRAA